MSGLEPLRLDPAGPDESRRQTSPLWISNQSALGSIRLKQSATKGQRKTSNLVISPQKVVETSIY